MAYGQPHVETIPTVSVTEGEEFATMVNAVLTEMRATLDAKVTPAGIDINADLSMRSGGTRYGLTNTHRVSLYQQPSNLAAATYPAALYASSAGELYFNDASGNQVALTNAGSIAGSPGSITGAGYGSGGVAVDWDSGAGDYHFYSAAATYADIKAGNVLLNDADTNFIRLDAPALAADYTLIFPNALPASTSLLSSTSGGQLAFTRDPTLDTLTLTGTSSFGGKATFSVEYAHPQRTQQVTALEMRVDSSVGALVLTGTDPHIDMSGAGSVYIPVTVNEGERLEQVVVWITASAGAGNRTAEIGYWNNTVGVFTYPGGAYAQTETTTSARYAITLNNTDITVSNPSGAGTAVGLLIVALALRSGDQVHGARLQYSRQ